MPARPCRHPGCPRLVTERGRTYCEKHAASVKKPCRNSRCPNLVPVTSNYCSSCLTGEMARYNAARGSARSQGYDRVWERVRLAYLGANPLCERCKAAGRVTEAALVHHRVAITDGGERLDEANLEALCRPCHEREHSNGARRKPVGG